MRLEPYSIRVAHRVSRQVFLEGQLERGIVPEDSTWTYCQVGNRARRRWASIGPILGWGAAEQCCPFAMGIMKDQFQDVDLPCSGTALASFTRH